MSSHGRLGGTYIAALMGEDSFRRTPLDIYNALLSNVRVPPNRYMARGTAMEPVVRSRYLATTGAELEPHPGVIRWREAFAASMDDIAVRDGVRRPVDYKTASANSRKKWANGPLASYTWQLRLYLAVLDAPISDLFVAFGKDRDAEQDEPGAFLLPDGKWGAFDIEDCQAYTVERDLALEQRMIEVGERFWTEHIVSRKPPAGPELSAPVVSATPELTDADRAALERLLAC